MISTSEVIWRDLKADPPQDWKLVLLATDRGTITAFRQGSKWDSQFGFRDVLAWSELPSFYGTERATKLAAFGEGASI